MRRNRVLFASTGEVRTSPVFLKRRRYILRTVTANVRYDLGGMMPYSGFSSI
jgi:hypothetical protein